jgi:putative DNA primase/helicase
MFTLYSADFTGNPGNCSYPHKTVVMNTDNLREAVCHDYVVRRIQEPLPQR